MAERGRGEGGKAPLSVHRRRGRDVLDRELARDGRLGVGVVHHPRLVMRVEMDRRQVVDAGPFGQFHRGLDGRVAVLAAGKDLVIAVRDRPVVAQPVGQFGGIRAGTEGVGIDVVQGARQTLDAVGRPVGRPQRRLRGDPRPDVPHERPVDRMRVWPRKDHRRGARHRADGHVKRHAPQRAERGGTADGGEAAVRMQHEIGKGETACHAARDLIAKDKGAQQVLGAVALGFGLGQKDGQAIDAGVADHAAIAFVQLGPVRRGSVRQGGRIAIQPRAARIEHRRLGRAAAFRHAVLQGPEFRFVPRRDHRGQVVRQHQRRAAPDRFRDVRPFRRRHKAHQLCHGMSYGFGTHRRTLPLVLETVNS